jgi:hypothetical protein
MHAGMITTSAFERLSGTHLWRAAANLCKPMEAVRELRRVIKEQGFKALRVAPWLLNLSPNDCRYYRLCRMHRTWHPVLHTGRAHRPTVPDPRPAGQYVTSTKWLLIFRSSSSLPAAWASRGQMR